MTGSPPARHAATLPTAIPRRQLLAYAGPVVGVAYLLFFVQFYFLKYATDVLLLPPAVVGGLFAAAKLWDAISNPIVGSWSDRTRSRFGRRRPFLLGALPLLAGGFVMLWNPPLALAGDGLVAWVGVALFVFFSAYALYAIPHAALGAEMSTDSHERTKLFGAKQIGFTFGLLLAFGAIQVAMNSGVPRETAAGLALPGAVAAVLLLAITPLAVHEPPGRDGGQSLLSGLRDVARNRPARLLLIVWFIECLGVGAVGTMAPYVAEYLLRQPEVVGALSASYVISGIVTIPLWVRLARRYGGRDTWLAAMLLAAAAFGGVMCVRPGDVALMIGLLAVAGCAMGCGSVLSSALMADLIDLDEQRTGERKEGVYSAAMMLMLKLGNSLATVLSGTVLDVAGFAPNAAQSDASLLGMRFLIGGLPCLGFIAGALVFRHFPHGRRPAPTAVPTPARTRT